VLVDADFAKPSVLSTLGLPGGPGLMDALADPAIDVADCVLGTDIPGLWVLPAGNATNSDSEFLSSARTRAVLDRLTQGAPNRMVIFDSPPALAARPNIRGRRWSSPGPTARGKARWKMPFRCFRAARTFSCC